jgi:hypothetical protein
VNVDAAEAPAVHATPPLAVALTADGSVEANVGRDNTAIDRGALDPCIQVVDCVLTVGLVLCEAPGFNLRMVLLIMFVPSLS